MEKPKFTIVYNSLSEDGYIGVCWEFYTDENKAQARYDFLAADEKKYCPTKRPYYHETDRHHLGAGHLELKKESGYEEGVYGYKTSIIDPLSQFNKNNFDPKKCQAGCKVFSGGERKHHKDCTYYKDSLSELLDERNEELNAYKEAYEDHKHLVREIDVILCGKDAAQQASLCDLVSPIRELKEQLNNMQEKVWDELKRKTVDTEKYGAVIPLQTLVRVLFKTQITKENENNFNATTVSKLRNQLSPYYSLPSMILEMDEHPELKPILIEQAKIAISTQDKIKELLTEIENESK